MNIDNNTVDTSKRRNEIVDAVLDTNHTFSEDPTFICGVVDTGWGWSKVHALKMDEHVAAIKGEVALISMNSSSALLNLENSTQNTVLQDQ